ncbi:MAG: N,N'-diacetylchitobiose phosphorylase [Candidatus Dichloromethanomonas elyunquensis]|nr:MAG: N,N'-diacetylchitobiose phosphorylase [Candidatus Dichloromethanomonas elyunquensis]
MKIIEKPFPKINLDHMDRRDDIMVYATDLAQFHHWLGLKNTGKSLLPVIRQHSAFIKEAYPKINEFYYKTDDIIPAAEWYLDNYYRINELMNELIEDLSTQYESKLQYLAGGDFTGFPRVYLLVSEFMKTNENQLDFQVLRQFIVKYQTESPLSSAEIWAVPIMLKIIMLEKIAYLVERILYIQKERAYAESWINSVLGQGDSKIDFSQQELDLSKTFSSVYIERVAKRLKELGTDAKVLLHWLENVANKQNITVDKVIHSEQYYLTSHGVLMGNIITAIKMINSQSWSEFFEGVSLVQQILQGDPAGIFSKMDFESRDQYRHTIENLAHKFKVSELTVARTLEILVKSKQEEPFNHVGYYLLGKGRIDLEKELTNNWGKVRQSFHGLSCFHKNYPALSYLGFIFLATLVPFFLFLGAGLGGLWEKSFGSYLFTALASLILINGMAVYFVNRSFCSILPASFLPKLDFGEEIPEDHKTVVVIPAIFNNPEKVTDLLGQLEIHYLSNREKNLYFALLGDFTDAEEETLPGDEEVVLAGIRGIQKLNDQYGDKFFFFHRNRKWNDREKSWMGWERKRGKLIEFNRFLLRDGDTSYSVKAGNLELLQNVRYVITLDSDTILPRSSARRLIGTIAHPMQKAKLNHNNQILSGYGIIQPRIGLTAAGAYASPFSAIYTGTAGIDPYTCAISDIYQDLFGEGIFTGKGIYDLKVFHVMTTDAFPENTILSHDLIEGLHARTGLATDIELFDGYPSKYLAYTKRMHRWIRGDWQIVRYLRNKDLSVISKWKIMDNLRRSVEAPFQFLLLFGAFTSLQGYFGLIFSLFTLTLVLPLILNLTGKIMDRSLTFRIFKYEVRLGLLQSFFAFAVLPFQAYIQMDAVIRSIWRQTVTKHYLLEWEPAADSEKMLNLNVKTFYFRMFPGILLSLLFIAGYYWSSLLTGMLLSLFLITWLGSPWIAYKLSRPYPDQEKEIRSEDRIELRKWARQVWAYFDFFVNQENNYLPPDNIQLEPYKGVARRTSPTNIGLALLANLAAYDFGYLSNTEMLNKVKNTLKTIRKLPKWNGHIYNWYNTGTLEPLYPIYISSVDSGNFATYLIALKNGIAEIPNQSFLESSFWEGFFDTCDLIENVSENSDYEMVLNDFKKELIAFRNRKEKNNLHGIYKFIVEWQERLTPYQIPIQKIMDKNFNENHAEFWTTALIGMFSDFKKVIKLYYPIAQYDSDIIESFQAIHRLRARELAKEYVKLLRNKQVSIPQDLMPYIKKGLKNTVKTLFRAKRLERELHHLAYDMDFKPLFDFDKKLFSIGYNLSEQKLDKSYYDLLASEARQTSLFAIAKGDVPEGHWFKLSRPLTRIEGNRCLVAWSGTMFEFLMPLILFKNFRGTLLDESYKSVLKIQRSYTGKAQTPWGISESGFFSFDIHNNYQYKAFGVPGLGLKRGLSKDMVISPYSTFMAMAVDFESSVENLKMMKKKGFNGIYGLFEAIDFTKTRVPYHEDFSVVKSYMSHHQGMSFISLNNMINGNKIQQRFHLEPVIKSIELLLQEQVPLKEYTFNPIIEELTEKEVPAVSRKRAEKPAIYRRPDTRMPRTAFISNREYTVMMTLSGSGYSQYNDIHVTRWREDPTMDMYGTFIYIQNLNSGNFWSAASKPVNHPGEDYKVTCFPNNVRYSRKDGNIITQTEVFVAPEDPVEIRKVSITNLSQYSRDIQLTSYLEVVLDHLKADMAHPGFSKLFIQTRFENNTLVAFRRPRHQDKKKFFAMHTFFLEGEMLGEIEYETDRMKFIGRGRTLMDPKAIDFNQPLSNSVGAILDPIMSLRVRVKVNAGRTVAVYFLTGVGESKKAVLSLADKYRGIYMVNQAKELAWSQNLMELTNLGLSFDEANMISSLASQIVFPGPVRRSIQISNNQRGQSSLWPYGISGDLPIVLLKIQDNSQMKLVDQMLKIHEYWQIKGLYVDLIILNEDKTGYFQTIQDMIQEKVGISHVRILIDKPGGVFLLKRDQLPLDIVLLLHTVSRMVFSGENGLLFNQIGKAVRTAEQSLPAADDKEKNAKNRERTEAAGLNRNELKDRLIYFNEYGGFSQDGREYVMIRDTEHITPLPWVNIIANPRFGTLVSDSGSSYTWSENSREHKLSPWSNDQLLDTSGEAIYLRDDKRGKFWSPTPQPVQTKQPYVVRHGQGYTVFEHLCSGIRQETTIYVPMEKNLKIVKLFLKNISDSKKFLSVYYYLEWVMGVNRELNAPYLVTEVQDDILFCRNVYQEEFFGRVAFLSSWGGKFKSFTTDRKEFIGVNQGLQEPAGLKADVLSGKTGNGMDPCGVIQNEVVLAPGEEEIVYFLVGDEADKEAAVSLVKSFHSNSQFDKAFQSAVNYWDDLLSAIQIKTPEPALDLLFNRWLIYQTLGCRIWARSAFYQSGGAFGFRDQLQDVLSFAVLRADITRKQIILHSSKQFPEGDVQHWWHSEKGKGVRTKFSDDLLWLPYVTADYIQHTADYSILQEKTPYLLQEPLSAEEDENYAIPAVSDQYATIYEHCVRAIDHSLKFGEHGLPLIGTGDWNDGFSAVGKEGKGESVWLGWFLLATLKNFIPVCKQQGDLQRVEQYQSIILELTRNMEKNAWDGSWYCRAYYDDGTPLGSISNTECQIDAIAQSWAVISESAKESRAQDAMVAMERYLWDKDEAILKLFAPPFDKTEKNPGYIRGYIPGVRENGGQYTHAAVWAVWAFTKMGEADKAMELLNMLNPINHSRTAQEAAKYKAEPYVMASDVYAVHPNIGRGGWTWYTGAAGWMYKVVLEGILGLRIENDKLSLSPCIPNHWQEFSIQYRHKTSHYDIAVRIQNRPEKSIFIDGVMQPEFPVILQDDGQNHRIEIIF